MPLCALDHGALHRLKLVPEYLLLGINHGLRRRAEVIAAVRRFVPPGALFVPTDRRIPDRDWLPAHVIAR